MYAMRNWNVQHKQYQLYKIRKNEKKACYIDINNIYIYIYIYIVQYIVLL